MRINDRLGLAAAALLVLAGVGARALEAGLEPVEAARALTLAPAEAGVGTTRFETPDEAFRAGARAYYAGDKDAAYAPLAAAAESGHLLAQWKLGRMYAEGDSVAADPLKAFGWFSRIADRHADESPRSPRAPFVASAFTALGTYWRDGIPDTGIRPDVARAVGLFTYAASYFGEADAQHELGRLYLEGEGVTRDLTRAARWLTLAARKNHRGAQATLGDLLFRGEGTLRHAAQGLMWLELARRAAAGPDDTWILYLHEHAFAEASKGDRDRAAEMADAFARRSARYGAPAAGGSTRKDETAADTSVQVK